MRKVSIKQSNLATARWQDLHVIGFLWPYTACSISLVNYQSCLNLHMVIPVIPASCEHFNFKTMQPLDHLGAKKPDIQYAKKSFHIPQHLELLEGAVQTISSNGGQKKSSWSPSKKCYPQSYFCNVRWWRPQTWMRNMYCKFVIYQIYSKMRLAMVAH